MRRYVMLAAALAALGTPAAAQRRPRPERLAPEARGAESLLRLRAVLELTDDQVSRLQAVRQERVAALQKEMSELIELRSRAQAGEISAQEFRRARLDRRGARLQDRARMSERLDGILTEVQRDKLRTVRREAMRFERRGGMRGRGFRQPGFRRPGRAARDFTPPGPLDPSDRP